MPTSFVEHGVKRPVVRHLRSWEGSPGQERVVQGV